MHNSQINWKYYIIKRNDLEAKYFEAKNTGARINEQKSRII